MKKNNAVSVVRIMLCALFLSGCLMIAVFGREIYRYTIVDWWIPVAVAVGVAMLTAIPVGRLWGRMWRIGIGWLDSCFGFLIVGALSYFGFLAVNSWCGETLSGYEAKAVVEERRQSVHSNSHRTGRHRYSSSGSYYKYHFLLRFEDGTLKEMEVGAKEYMKARAHGDTLTLIVRRGCLGFTVVDEIKPLAEMKSTDKRVIKR